MLCDVCKKNEATVHLTQIVENKMQTIDLCEACSKAKGVDDPTGFSLASLLVGLGAAQDEAAPAEATETTEETRCAKCGFSAADFKKAGRLGCSECYSTFADQLDGLLKTMHKGTKHAGKVPGGAKNRDTAEKVRQMQAQLESAVQTEDFERAAVLRDEIKKLKAQAEAARSA